MKVSIEEWAGAQIQWNNLTKQWVLTGPMRKVLDILSKNKFTYTLIRADDCQWGFYQDNNSWTGMMGLLDTNKTDLALGPIALSYHRSTIAPFTRPLFSDEMSILSAYLNNEPDIFKILFMFLNHKIWCTLFISLLVLSITTSLSIRLKSNDDLYKYGIIHTVGNNLWVLLTILFLRGNGLPRTMISPINRSLITLISTISLFLTTILSALIGMSIIIGPEIANIDSLEELLQRQDVKPLLLEGSYEMQLFKNNSVDIYNKLWLKLKNNLISSEQLYHSNKIMTDIIEGKSVLIDGTVNLYGFAAETCKRYPNAKLYLGKEKFLPTQYVLMTSKETYAKHRELHEYLDKKFLTSAQQEYSAN